MSKKALNALHGLSISAHLLLEAWDEASPSTDNNFNEEVNDVMSTGYPFNRDFAEIVLFIDEWYWKAINSYDKIQKGA